MYEIKVNDVIELYFEKYGEILPYIVEEVKENTNAKAFGYHRNSKRFRLRKLTDKDRLTKTVSKDGDIVWCIN